MAIGLISWTWGTDSGKQTQSRSCPGTVGPAERVETVDVTTKLDQPGNQSIGRKALTLHGLAAAAVTLK
jgi:hypothetical protein